jgi:LysM repeat protein
MAAIAHPHPRESAPQRPHLRLVPPRRRHAVYRRRRVVVVVAALLLSLILGLAAVGAATVLGGAASDGTGATPAPASTADVYVVQPGDTLWTIARSLQPEGDVRGLVDRLDEAHGPGPLRPGERLAID